MKTCFYNIKCQNECFICQNACFRILMYWLCLSPPYVMTFLTRDTRTLFSLTVKIHWLWNTMIVYVIYDVFMMCLSFLWCLGVLYFYDVFCNFVMSCDVNIILWCDLWCVLSFLSVFGVGCFGESSCIWDFQVSRDLFFMMLFIICDVIYDVICDLWCVLWCYLWSVMCFMMWFCVGFWGKMSIMSSVNSTARIELAFDKWWFAPFWALIWCDIWSFFMMWCDLYAIWCVCDAIYDVFVMFMMCFMMCFQAHHFVLCKRLNNLNPRAPFSKQIPEHQMFLSELLLHASDLAGQGAFYVFYMSFLMCFYDFYVFYEAFSMCFQCSRVQLL